MKKLLLIFVLYFTIISMQAQKVLQVNIYNTSLNSTYDGAAKFTFIGNNEPVIYSTKVLSYNEDSITYIGDTISGIYSATYITYVISVNTEDTIGTICFNVGSPLSSQNFDFFYIVSYNYYLSHFANSSTTNSCNGSISFEKVSGLDQSMHYFLKNENNELVEVDTFNFSGLCPGKYYFYSTMNTIDTNLAYQTTFWIDADVHTPSNIHVDVNTTSSLSDSCTGSAHAFASNGTAPYLYFWNGGTATGIDSISNLCPGIYNLLVTDSNNDSVAVNYFVANENNTINNPNTSGYEVLDTVYSYIENCNINYELPIDSIAFTDILYTDSNSFILEWTIWQDTVITEVYSDTITFNPAGVEMIITYIYCPYKSYGNVIKVVDYLKPDFTYFGNENIINNVSIYPNPASDILSVDISNFSKVDNYKLIITDIQGRILIKKDILNNATKLDVSTLENGIYLINIAQNKKNKTIKLIKE